MTRATPTPPLATSLATPAWSASDLQNDPHAAPDKAVRVQRMFAAIARSYDLNNRLHSLGRDQAWRRKAVKLCHVKPSDRILDVACGTGDLTQAFAAANPASVTGLDFTAEMLDIARHKSSRSRRSTARPLNSPNYIQGDATNLPFADGSFDIVSIAFGIRNVGDPMKALREFRRVLAPARGGGGGRLMVLEFSQPGNGFMRWFNEVYCARIMPITATMISRDRSGAYRYLPQSVAKFPSGEAFATMLREAGFASVSMTPMTCGICTAYLASSE